jgi:hypothetical protein
LLQPACLAALAAVLTASPAGAPAPARRKAPAAPPAPRVLVPLAELAYATVEVGSFAGTGHLAPDGKRILMHDDAARTARVLAFPTLAPIASRSYPYPPQFFTRTGSHAYRYEYVRAEKRIVLFLFDPDTLEQLARVDHPAGTEPFGPDLRWVAVKDDDRKAIRVIDFRTGAVVKELRSTDATVIDADRLAVKVADERWEVRDVANWSVVATLDGWSVTVPSDGGVITAGTPLRTTTFYDIKTLRPLFDVPASAWLTNDGQHVVASYQKSNLCVLRDRAGRARLALPTPEGAWLGTSRDGSFVLHNDGSGTDVLEATSFRRVARFPAANLSEAPDGEHLLLTEMSSKGTKMLQRIGAQVARRWAKDEFETAREHAERLSGERVPLAVRTPLGPYDAETERFQVTVLGQPATVAVPRARAREAVARRDGYEVRGALVPHDATRAALADAVVVDAQSGEKLGELRAVPAAPPPVAVDRARDEARVAEAARLAAEAEAAAQRRQSEYLACESGCDREQDRCLDLPHSGRECFDAHDRCLSACEVGGPPPAPSTAFLPPEPPPSPPAVPAAPPQEPTGVTILRAITQGVNEARTGATRDPIQAELERQKAAIEQTRSSR